MRRLTFGLFPLAFLLFSQLGYSSTITFGSLNQSVTSAPYLESGYQFKSLVGSNSCIQERIGSNPVNSFFAFGCVDPSPVGDQVQLSLISGSTFQFTSIDIGGLNGGLTTAYDTISIFGYANNILVGSMANLRPTTTNGFSTLNSTIAGSIDRLVFQVAAVSTNATLFDNVVVTADPLTVPEPSFAALSLAILGALAWKSRKR